MTTPRTAIETYTGKWLDLANPNPVDMCVEDVAHHLSMLCRFVGAVDARIPYTVAQHSLLVLNLVRHVARVTDKPLEPQFQMRCLMRDAPKTWMGDCSGPMKKLLFLQRGISHLEAGLERAFLTALAKWCRTTVGDLSLSADQAELLKAADTWAFEYESYNLMRSGGTMHAQRITDAANLGDHFAAHVRHLIYSEQFVVLTSDAAKVQFRQVYESLRVSIAAGYKIAGGGNAT